MILNEFMLKMVMELNMGFIIWDYFYFMIFWFCWFRKFSFKEKNVLFREYNDFVELEVKIVIWIFGVFYVIEFISKEEDYFINWGN